jgi:hypothetical protein
MCAFKRLIRSPVAVAQHDGENIMRGIKSENKIEIQEEFKNTFKKY